MEPAITKVVKEALCFTLHYTQQVRRQRSFFPYLPMQLGSNCLGIDKISGLPVSIPTNIPGS